MSRERSSHTGRKRDRSERFGRLLKRGGGSTTAGKRRGTWRTASHSSLLLQAHGLSPVRLSHAGAMADGNLDIVIRFRLTGSRTRRHCKACRDSLTFTYSPESHEPKGRPSHAPKTGRSRITVLGRQNLETVSSIPPWRVDMSQPSSRYVV